jgi:hypothetical protein
MKVLSEPNFNQIQEMIPGVRKKYMTANVCTQHLNISNLLYSKITGTIILMHTENEKVKWYNVGLSLKIPKKNQEVSFNIRLHKFILLI